MPINVDALAKSRTEQKTTVFQGRQTIRRSEIVDSERNMAASFPPDRSALTFCEAINVGSIPEGADSCKSIQTKIAL